MPAAILEIPTLRFSSLVLLPVSSTWPRASTQPPSSFWLAIYYLPILRLPLTLRIPHTCYLLSIIIMLGLSFSYHLIVLLEYGAGLSDCAGLLSQFAFKTYLDERKFGGFLMLASILYCGLLK